MKEKLIELVRAQQKGHENTPRFFIGEQLLEMADGDEKVTELLVNDLQTLGMMLADAEKELQAYSDKNHGKAKCFCISPKLAEKILRKFYGLPEASANATPAAEPTTDAPLIDLSNFFD